MKDRVFPIDGIMLVGEATRTCVIVNGVLMLTSLVKGVLCYHHSAKKMNLVGAGGRWRQSPVDK